jgi:hypothetical protein
MVNIGDRLVVQGSQFPAYVERIEEDPTTASTILHLDWKEYGKSRVYLHDEGKVWYQYSNLN